MLLQNSNISVKINNIIDISWEKSSVDVAPRPYFALVFRKKGSAVFSHGGIVSCASQDDITFMPANYSYHADYSEKNEIFAIHFEAEGNFELESFRVCSPKTILKLFENAHNIWKDKSGAYYYRCTALFYEILANISSDIPVSELYKDFFKAVEYIQNNFAKNDITVSYLASIAKMSDTYFRKLFFDKFCDTPSNFLTNLRLKHAEMLLSTGKYSVSETAFLSGFSDPKYFSRVVKERYNCPPSRLFVHKKVKIQ